MFKCTTRLIVVVLILKILWDRFYETPFWPNYSRVNFHPKTFGQISTQKQHLQINIFSFNKGQQYFIEGIVI
jgi:hypothetical protein